MSAGTRLAAQYRAYGTDQLRSILPMIRNARRLAAVNIVLAERENTHQFGYDAAQITLDVIGASGLADMILRAEATMLHKQGAQDWTMYEFAHGYREALEDYQRDRADT